MNTDIAALTKRVESETLEFKGPQASQETVAKDVCAMLNQRGGVLLWGVTDNRKVVGLSDADARAKQLNEYIVTYLHPRPLISISVDKGDGRDLVVIDVPPGSDKPYTLKRHIWIRVSTHTLRATTDVSTDLVEQRAALLERWERESNPGFSQSDCDVKELAQARSDFADTGRFGASVPNRDEDLLRDLYLLHDGQLTNAAVV